MSRQRFVQYVEGCGGGGTTLEVGLAGAPGETVGVAFVEPHSTKVHVATVVLSNTGTGTVHVPP